MSPTRHDLRHGAAIAVLVPLHVRPIWAAANGVMPERSALPWRLMAILHHRNRCPTP
jgi:hypothetical protein